MAQRRGGEGGCRRLSRGWWTPDWGAGLQRAAGDWLCEACVADFGVGRVPKLKMLRARNMRRKKEYAAYTVFSFCCATYAFLWLADLFWW